MVKKRHTQMKKILTLLLAIILMVPAVNIPANATESKASKFVELDGEWNFKLYRTYNRMFQYFPYNMVNVTWEDADSAGLPDESVWNTWEKVDMPWADVSTGGLLPIDRPAQPSVLAEEENETEPAAEDEQNKSMQTFGTEAEQINEPESKSNPEEAIESSAAADTAKTAEPVSAPEPELTDGPTATPNKEPSASETTSDPIPTAAPETIVNPELEPSTVPETTAEPEPSAVPETTAEPEPTAAPETTAEPEQTNVPESEPEPSLSQAVLGRAASASAPAPLAASAPDTAMFPSWSEAWVCRNFDLPADFTSDHEVTLLMGIIDDMDVIYINGQLVASSGFVDGNGNKTNQFPANGGFDYSNANKEEQVKFEKSYWEVNREYKIPTSCLNLGGKNEICIRVYNNNGNGGFYSGNPYAICGNELAVRAVKDLPADPVTSAELDAVVQSQINAMNAGDMNAYAATISDDYKNDGHTKEERLKEIQDMLSPYDNISVQDENAGAYKDDQGRYWYSANRTITGNDRNSGTQAVIFSDTVEICYADEGGKILEYGNWSRCYAVSYESALFNQTLKYGIYLPPGYYENDSRNYPVVYLLHGINSSSSSFINVDQIGAFMDQQIASGAVTEMIVVMPDSGKNSFYRDSDYDPSNHDSTGPWRTHVTSEIRSEILKNYRALGDAKFSGVTGISMGGFGAMCIGTLYPELYTSVASHMGALNQESLNCLKSLSESQLEAYDFYVDCGLQDTMVDYRGTVNTHEYLDSVGKEHGYDLRDGGHNSAFYMTGMPASMKMHSDHFLKNGLFDAELSNTSGTFDKNSKGSDHKEITIPLKLNGNVIISIDKQEEGTDYRIDTHGIVLLMNYLNTLTEDTDLKINLASGKSFSFHLKVTDTTDQEPDVTPGPTVSPTPVPPSTPEPTPDQGKGSDNNSSDNSGGAGGSGNDSQNTPAATGDTSEAGTLLFLMISSILAASISVIYIKRRSVKNI